MVNKLDIPNKCERCDKRKPSTVIFSRGLTSNFSIDTYAEFVCGKCVE